MRRRSLTTQAAALQDRPIGIRTLVRHLVVAHEQLRQVAHRPKLAVALIVTGCKHLVGFVLMQVALELLQFTGTQFGTIPAAALVDQPGYSITAIAPTPL